MAIDPALPTFRRASYLFGCALLLGLFALILIRPPLTVFATGGIFGLIAFFVQRAKSRIGQGAAGILSIALVIGAGLWVTEDRSVAVLFAYYAAAIAATSSCYWLFILFRKVKVKR